MDSQWQQGACATLGIPYKLPNWVSPGGPAIPLTCPDKVRKITGDGNCLLCSFSSIATGVQTEHLEIRAAILRHMDENKACMVLCGLVSDKVCRITYMAHLMRASILVYKIDLDVWQRHSPAFMDPNFNDDMTQMAMYIRNPSSHFDVVLSVSDPPQSEHKKEYSRAHYKVNPDPKNQSKFDTLDLYV